MSKWLRRQWKDLGVEELRAEVGTGGVVLFALVLGVVFWGLATIPLVVLALIFGTNLLGTWLIWLTAPIIGLMTWRERWRVILLVVVAWDVGCYAVFRAVA